MPRLPHEIYTGRWESYEMSDAPMVPFPDGTFLLPVCTTRERLKTILWALHDYFPGDLRDLEHLIDVLEAMPYINNPFGRDCVKSQLKDDLSVELCDDGQSVKILLAGEPITDCLPLNLPDCETETSNGDCGCNDDCGCCEDDCGDCGCNDSNEDCGCCDDCNDCGCEGHEMAIKDIEIRDGYLWKINCNGSEERLMPLSGGDADIAHEIGASTDISVIKTGIESATGQTLTGTPKISCVKATRLIEALRVRVAKGAFDGSSEPDPYATLGGDTGGWHIGGALTSLPSALGYMFTGGDQAAQAAGYNDTALWDDLICTLTQALTADFALTEIDIEITKQVLENHGNDYISKAVNYVWDASQKSFFKEQVMIALLNPDAPCNCTSLYASGSGDIDLSTYEPQVAVDEWFIYPLTFEATSPVDDGSFWLGAKFEFPATSYGIWGVKFSIQKTGANTAVRRQNDSSSNAQLWTDLSENLSSGAYWLIHENGYNALGGFGTRLTNPAYPDATSSPQIAAGTASAMQVDFSPDNGAANSVVYDVQLIGVKK